MRVWLGGATGCGLRVGCRQLRVQVIETCGELFRKSPGIDEHQCGAVSQHFVEHASLDGRPYRTTHRNRRGVFRRLRCNKSFAFQQRFHGRTHAGDMRSMTFRMLHSPSPPFGIGRSWVSHGRERFHHFQIHVRARSRINNTHRPIAAEEASRLLKRLHRGGEPDTLHGTSGKTLKTLQAQRQMGTAFASGDRMHFVHNDRFNSGQYSPRFGSKQQEQRFGCGDEDIRRVADDSTPFLRCGVAAAHAHSDFQRWQSHCLALRSDSPQRRFKIFRHIHAERLQW